MPAAAGISTRVVPADAMKLLAIGDMHLGRVPVALPDNLIDRALKLGPEAAWSRCIERAIELEVEAVVLAGDVVDRERDFFGGYNALRQGIEKLTAAGIEVIAVAGNHDTQVLPRLADALPALKLLGRGGHWQTLELSEAVVLGWSFPSARVAWSPLETLTLPETGLPILGLLHCDRDQPGSVYAPVTSAELAAVPVSAWLLGHVHQPDFGDTDEPGRPCGYLGSVSALRASETGPRGPWLIELDGRRVRSRQLALAPLAYDAIDIDVAALEQAGDLAGLILKAAKAGVRQRIAADALPDALGLRICLVGQTPIGAALADQAAQLDIEATGFDVSGCQVFVDRIDSAFAPALDLKALARQPDPAGLLARDLLLLQGPDCEPRRRLIAQARPGLERIASIAEFQALVENDAGPGASAISADEIVKLLIESGRAALIQLLEQRA
ncbi:MAG: metallophosphoesterase [Xanthomonadaceae bacterium]|nr:metallophosphoesterase [Xanthomonadaceae bacterium]